MCYEWEYSAEEHFIHFDRQGNPYPYGFFQGVCVHVDRYHYKDVSLGDTWLCRIARKGDGLEERYYAMPLERVSPVVNTAVDEPVSPTEGTETMQTYAEIPEPTEQMVVTQDGRLVSNRLSAARYNVYGRFRGTYIDLVPDDEGDFPCESSVISGIPVLVGRGPGILRFHQDGGTIRIRL